jgi:Fe2+ transport protein
MSTLDRRRDPLRRTAPISLVALVALVALLAAGCAGPGATASATAKQSTSTSAAQGSSGSDGMSGMAMTASPAAAAGASAGGISPVPTQVLGTAIWQGMKITAQAMTAVPFLIYNGTSMQEVKPPKNVSFHLMVMLNDAQTGVVIPYASVWATITEGSKTLFDESLWPMISRYTGPHYGNDVVLPGVGTYKLSLLVSPPVSARHLEYQDVWLAAHRVSFTFRWKPAS